MSGTPAMAAATRTPANRASQARSFAVCELLTFVHWQPAPCASQTYMVKIWFVVMFTKYRGFVV